MNESFIRPLSELQKGRHATVVALAGENESESRLVSMGLHVGSRIKVVGTAGRQGPTLVAAGETRLAVGPCMAQAILVSVDTDG